MTNGEVFNDECRASKDELQVRTDAAAGWGKPRGDTVDDECASGRVMPNEGRIGDDERVVDRFMRGTTPSCLTNVRRIGQPRTYGGSGMAKRVMDRGRRTCDGSGDDETCGGPCDDETCGGPVHQRHDASCRSHIPVRRRTTFGERRGPRGS
jgi:hypothetical protein